MENLDFSENTTLYPPDKLGVALIEIVDKSGNTTHEYVSFEELEAWVASINKQIITVATDACADKDRCDKQKQYCPGITGPCFR